MLCWQVTGGRTNAVAGTRPGFVLNTGSHESPSCIFARYVNRDDRSWAGEQLKSVPMQLLGINGQPTYAPQTRPFYRSPLVSIPALVAALSQ
jgi:hypothetical protein